MRLSFLLPLLLLAACPEPAKDDSGTEADADTDTDSDTDTDTDTDTDSDTDADTDADADTAIVGVVWEGDATFTAGADDWVGEESYVAYATSDSHEMCRLTSPNTGAAYPDVCEGCTWGFEISSGAGALAGDQCDGLGWTDDMFGEGSWLYAFLPTYVYEYGDSVYTYDNVVMYGYEYEGTVNWYPFAFAEDESTSSVVYRSMFPSYYYYYY